MNSHLETYQKINDSFSDTLVFCVGDSQGFFSEINTMLFTIIYCIEHNLRFTLYADNANFANNRGWEEFFEPFCELKHEKFHPLCNIRRLDTKKNANILRKRLKQIRTFFRTLYYKFRFNYIYLNSETWRAVHNTNRNIHIPDLNLDGKLIQEYAKIASFALKYNEETKKEVEKIISSLNLPENFISMQVRAGDKITETSLISLDRYIKEIENSGIEFENIFIFTDDYSHIIELKQKRPHWNLFTLTSEDERGYYNAKFNSSSWENKKANLLKLFATIDICICSDFHFGTSTSNPHSYICSHNKNNLNITLK